MSSSWLFSLMFLIHFLKLYFFLLLLFITITTLQSVLLSYLIKSLSATCCPDIFLVHSCCDNLPKEWQLQFLDAVHHYKPMSKIAFLLLLHEPCFILVSRLLLQLILKAHYLICFSCAQITQGRATVLHSLRSLTAGQKEAIFPWPFFGIFIECNN